VFDRKTHDNSIWVCKAKSLFNRGVIKVDIISWEEFGVVELRTGTVIEVTDFPEARKPAYKLKVDFGPDIGVKQSSAQITALYSKEQLLGKQVIGVVNFPTKQIGPFRSECLITGFYRPDGAVVLAVPEQAVQNGSKLS
jgi:tRNA-binding protein